MLGVGGVHACEGTSPAAFDLRLGCRTHRHGRRGGPRRSALPAKSADLPSRRPALAQLRLQLPSAVCVCGERARGRSVNGARADRYLRAPPPPPPPPPPRPRAHETRRAQHVDPAQVGPRRENLATQKTTQLSVPPRARHASQHALGSPFPRLGTHAASLRAPAGGGRPLGCAAPPSRLPCSFFWGRGKGLLVLSSSLMDTSPNQQVGNLLVGGAHTRSGGPDQSLGVRLSVHEILTKAGQP